MLTQPGSINPAVLNTVVHPIMLRHHREQGFLLVQPSRTALNAAEGRARHVHSSIVFPKCFDSVATGDPAIEEFRGFWQCGSARSTVNTGCHTPRPTNRHPPCVAPTRFN